MSDIDDIIASVALPTAHDSRLLDLQALTRAWINERGAPDLLVYPTVLMARVQSAIRAQIEAIELLAGTMDPTSNFRLVIMQSELERFRFLLRSYLRTRLAKVDKYAQHYRARVDKEALLSPLEQQYLESHSTLLSTHYHAAFLASFPQALQKLDDVSGGISMLDAPDRNSAVFIRVLRDCGQIEAQGEQGTHAIDLNRGDIWVVRWGSIQEHVELGNIELL